MKMQSLSSFSCPQESGSLPHLHQTTPTRQLVSTARPASRALPQNRALAEQITARRRCPELSSVAPAVVNPPKSLCDSCCSHSTTAGLSCCPSFHVSATHSNSDFSDVS